MRTVVAPALGGVLVGIGLLLALVAARRPVGVSGVLAGALSRNGATVSWRWWFLGGLLAGGAVLRFAWPAAVWYALPRSLPVCAAAGLLVGFGTRMGGGCTSGHGVCGVGRLAPRSLLATAVFVLLGMVTAAVVRAAGAS